MPADTSTIETQVLVIGGGATGTGIARDLALRGVTCVVAERRDLNAGASGANHGLLHSGARYVSGDLTIAAECRREAELIKQLAPHCIEDTGGLFVAVEGDDETYIADFPDLCAKAGIPVATVPVVDALEMEPRLSPKLIAAYRVADATIDPFRLSLENMSQAQQSGSVLLRNTPVVAFRKKRGRIHETVLQRQHNREKIVVRADQVVNASGAWAGQVAALAGAAIDMVYAKGSLLILDDRISQRVINRLRPSSNADILVPGGTVSILGTTSVAIENLDDVRPPLERSMRLLPKPAPCCRCYPKYAVCGPIPVSGPWLVPVRAIPARSAAGLSSSIMPTTSWKTLSPLPAAS